MDKEKRAVIFISGKITGEPDYKLKFEETEATLRSKGYIPLSPAHLPAGMTNAQYIHICQAMINCADAVLFLPDWSNSPGARLEQMHCLYTEKPMAYNPDGLEMLLKGEPNEKI